VAHVAITGLKKREVEVALRRVQSLLEGPGSLGREGHLWKKKNAKTRRAADKEVSQRKERVIRVGEGRF